MKLAPRRAAEMIADQPAMVNEIKEGLVSFVTRTFMVRADEIDMDKSLIDQGIIDSFGLVELTAYIESAFQVKILEQDMTRESFGSMNKMTTFVFRRKNGEI
jgi:acyl carrier protein